MLLQAVASGIALGVIYAGLGAGFSLIMSTGRLTNLSHGEFVLVGGYILYFLCHGIGLRARIPTIPASALLRRVPHDPFALAVRHLTVRRNGTTVLTNVDFAVEPGRILRVVGPNGAGKTSLLLAIAGRLPAAEGGIFFGDDRLRRNAKQRSDPRIQGLL
jgi:ABC-type multidrug transport system fused ATPase/permease subunit